MNKVNSATKNKVNMHTKFELYQTGKIKKFRRAPLPFNGQKKDFITEFVDKVVFGIPQDRIVVDLFGGSGLLAHTVKYYRPDLRVVCNDFDRYIDRINQIEETNQIMRDLRRIIKTEKIFGTYTRMNSDEIKEVKEYLFSKNGYDWRTVTSNILPVSRRITAKTNTMYNLVLISDYSADGYLCGVERAEMDYNDLMEAFSGEKVFWIVDPPYANSPNPDLVYKGAGFLSLEEISKKGNFVYFRAGEFFDENFYCYSRKNMHGQAPWIDNMITDISPIQGTLW